MCANNLEWLKNLLAQHQKEVMIMCEETCWCWDLEQRKMKIGDKVILLTPGVVKEIDEFGNVVVQWGDGLIGYYQENELEILN